MSRRRSKSGSDARFVSLHHYILNSPACMTLPGDALKILVYVWKRYNGSNNGEITFGVREAEELEITKSTAARMFDILVKRGFLAVVRESHFGRKKLARTWRITAEPYRNEKASKEFMHWKPTAEKPANSPTSGTIEPPPRKEFSVLPVGHTVPPVGQE